MSRRGIYNYKVYVPIDPKSTPKEFDTADYKVIREDIASAPFDNLNIFLDFLVNKCKSDTNNIYSTPNCVVGVSIDGGEEQYYKLEISFQFKPIMHI